PCVQEVAYQAAAQAARPRVVLARGGVLGDAQFLADPEHQEQAVVRARAQDQHDEQELSDRGDLEAVLRGLGDQRPGDRDRDQRGRDRYQGQRERAEDQYQQPDDEQQRQCLELGVGVTGRFLLVHLRGDVTRQVRLQPGGQVRLGDLGAQPVDQVGDVAIVAAGLLGERDQLYRVPVGGLPGVLHLGDAADLLELGRQRGHGRDVRRSERARSPVHYERNGYQGGGAERRGKLDRVLARGAGRQELAVVVLGDV